MKIGVCVGVPGGDAGSSGPDMLKLAAETGFDYVEMPLAQLMELDAGAFSAVRQKLAEAGVKCESLNVFFPAKVRLTGGVRDEAAIADYIERACARAGEIGARVIVFGSGGAKNVPEGFSHETAFEQIVWAMKMAAGPAERNGLMIAIEALNSREANIILSLADADRLMAAIDSPNIKILLDYYHYMIEADSDDVLRKLLREGKIIHAHYAEASDRTYPAAAKITPEAEAIFKILRDGGYGARCSIEARLLNPDDPRAEMEAGLAALRMLASV